MQEPQAALKRLKKKTATKATGISKEMLYIPGKSNSFAYL